MRSATTGGRLLSSVLGVLRATSHPLVYFLFNVIGRWVVSGVRNTVLTVAGDLGQRRGRQDSIAIR